MTPHRPPFTLFAGVEISQGALSTLHHGEIDSAHTFGDPVEAARHFVSEGAQWLHVADLDGYAGTGSNAAVVASIIRESRAHAHVQVAGGFSTAADVDAALAMGAARVVLDTEALADPEAVTALVAQYGNRIVVGITSEGNRVFAPRSDLHETGLEALLVQARDTKAHAYLITDVDSRGIRKSHERNALDTVLRSVHGHAVSGGGVFRLGDLHALTELIPHGLDGAVIDAALYTGGFTFAEAVAALEERYDLFFWGPPIG